MVSEASSELVFSSMYYLLQNSFFQFLEEWCYKNNCNLWNLLLKNWRTFDLWPQIRGPLIIYLWPQLISGMPYILLSLVPFQTSLAWFQHNCSFPMYMTFWPGDYHFQVNYVLFVIQPVNLAKNITSHSNPILHVSIWVQVSYLCPEIATNRNIRYITTIISPCSSLLSELCHATSFQIFDRTDEYTK